MNKKSLWAPGDGKTAHVDTFARDNLPPTELWPQMDYSTLPELAAYPGRFNAAVELLDKAVDERGWGGRTLFHYGDKSWTYAEVKDITDRIAKVLTEDMGLVPGNRVLLRGPNNPGMAAAWLAVLKAGGIVVATMPLLRGRELAYIACVTPRSPKKRRRQRSCSRCCRRSNISRPA